MSEVSVVMQMYQSLSPEEKAAFLRMLGLPPELTEIIDSETIEASWPSTASRTGKFAVFIVATLMSRRTGVPAPAISSSTARVATNRSPMQPKPSLAGRSAPLIPTCAMFTA